MKKTLTTAVVVIVLALLAGCKCDSCSELSSSDGASFPVQDKWWE